MRRDSLPDAELRGSDRPCLSSGVFWNVSSSEVSLLREKHRLSRIVRFHHVQTMSSCPT